MSGREGAAGAGYLTGSPAFHVPISGRKGDGPQTLITNRDIFCVVPRAAAT